MSVSSPACSVIVPAFNSEDRIEGVLRSALAQREEGLELIVVDDGSSDGTAGRVAALAARDDRVRLIEQENTGTVGARNAGIAAARGSYVSFLDDDDLWLPVYLEQARAALERDSGIGIVYSDAWLLNASSGRVWRAGWLDRYAAPLRRLPARLDADQALRALLRINFLPTCSVTVRATALERAGELDPEIVGCDDWDLWLRIAAAGFGMERLEGRPVVQRKRSDSVGTDQLLMAHGSRLALERALARGIEDPDAGRIARAHLAAIEREIEVAKSGSRLRRAVAAVRRRWGRKRALRVPGERDAPDAVAELLSGGESVRG